MSIKSYNPTSLTIFLSSMAVCSLISFNVFAASNVGSDKSQTDSEHKDMPLVPGDISYLYPDVKDKWISKWLKVTADRSPMALKAGVDYGLNKKTGDFVWPKATPEDHSGQTFPGELGYPEDKMYTKNVKVLGYYPKVTSPFQAWTNIADFGGHRYLYTHDRDFLTVMDITDPANAKILYRDGSIWGPKGRQTEEGEPYPYDAANVHDYWGGITIAYSKQLKKPVIVASFETGRYGIMTDKITQPDKVELERHYNSLKGFKVFEMNGPMPEDWKLIATRTTDRANPKAKIGEQQGCGSADQPAWFGGQYMGVSAAPDDSYALTEYPNYLCSNGYQIWDMSEPTDPKFVSQITVPGQKADDEKSIEAYLKNPRAGNRTSWMGSRMPMFQPKAIEEGGKYGFGAMGGLGLWSFDLSNPNQPEALDNINTSPSFAGTEFDNAEVSQFERTGYIFTSGYPMNRDCYEPKKDIFVIDARDPSNMQVAGKLPTPQPPEDAPYTSFCQRGGNFGPKRSNAVDQPGKWKQGIIPYSYYSAGIQLFDVKDPTNPKIAGYFIPPFVDDSELPSYTLRKGVFAMYTEYDRNIMWAYTENGVYALSSPLLGKPKTGVPDQTWPKKD